MLIQTVLFVSLLLCLCRADFGGGNFGGGGGTAKKKDNNLVPTCEPTTSQPSGWKAPSVPAELLAIPIVDLTAVPSPLAGAATSDGGALGPGSKNGPSLLASRYQEQKHNAIPGSANVNEELESESVTAMTSVAYIFVTFVSMMFILGGLMLWRQRDRGGGAYALVSSSMDSHDMGTGGGGRPFSLR